MIRIAVALFAAGTLAGVAQSPAAPPAAEDVLAASIAYHDPGGVWSEGAFRLELEETRPNGSDRATVLEIDHPDGRFAFRSETDEHVVEGEVDGTGCTTRLDGSETISDADRERLRLSCERIAWRRDYYDYLWGLPMKLRDPGTIVDPAVEKTTYRGRDVLGLRVTYEEGVGSDVWYVYFDLETFAMVGYRFYHDEAKNDGEYIILEGETAGAGLRLPRERTWYTHAGDQLLGTDTLRSIEPLD